MRGEASVTPSRHVRRGYEDFSQRICYDHTGCGKLTVCMTLLSCRVIQTWSWPAAKGEKVGSAMA